MYMYYMLSIVSDSYIHEQKMKIYSIWKKIYFHLKHKFTIK